MHLKELLENLFWRKKQKLHQLLWHLFLNHWILTDRPKSLMQIQLEIVVKLHVLILLPLKNLYLYLSLKLHKCLYQNLLKSNRTVLILSINQYRVETRNARITQGKWFWLQNQKFRCNRWQNNRWEAFFHN